MGKSVIVLKSFKGLDGKNYRLSTNNQNLESMKFLKYEDIITKEITSYSIEMILGNRQTSKLIDVEKKVFEAVYNYINGMSPKTIISKCANIIQQIKFDIANEEIIDQQLTFNIDNLKN